MADFEKFLASCQVERLECLHRELEEVPEIRFLRHQAAQILDEVRGLLVGRQVDLLSKYDDILNGINSLETAYMYKKGLKDGVMLGRILFEGKKDVDISIKVL